MNKFTLFGAIAFIIGLYFAMSYEPKPSINPPAPQAMSEVKPPESEAKKAQETGAEKDMAADADSGTPGEGEGKDEVEESKQEETSKPMAVKKAPSGPAPKYTTKRLEYVRKSGVAEEYASLTNPLEPTEENVKKGERLFASKCALCHGTEGRGDGAAGMSLKPPASDLALLAAQDDVTEAYLFWAISEGGGPIGSSMPPFKASSETDRWSLVLYITHGLSWE